jgi:hypothetical protein
MKKSMVRTSSLALTLVLGAVMATSSIAQPSQPGIAARAASFMVTPLGYQPGLLSECDHVTHENFCYCTGACHP